MKVSEFIEILSNVKDKSKDIEVEITQYTEDLSDGSISEIIEKDDCVSIHLNERTVDCV